MKKTSFAARLAGLPAVLAAAAFMQSPGALADPAVGIDPTGTQTFTYTDLWTNLTDSALAIGFIPNVTIPPGNQYDIELLAQARVGTFQLNGLPVFTPADINQDYEITKVLDINERVLTEDGQTATFGLAATQPDIDPNTAGDQQLMIFLDNPINDGSQANPNNVSCYGAGSTACTNDGVLIMSAHIVFNSSSFTASGGVGTGSFDLRFVIDYVNPDYLDIATNSIFGDKITGTTNVPSFFNPSVMWDGTSTTSGLLLKVDSSESFFQTPEPGSLALLGLGFAGLGAFIRRRRSIES